MEIAEIVRLGRELLKMMSEYDVRIEDWKYLRLYEEYKAMRSKNVKYRFVISELALTHNISRSKVERIVRRLGRVVK